MNMRVKCVANKTVCAKAGEVPLRGWDSLSVACLCAFRYASATQSTTSLPLSRALERKMDSKVVNKYIRELIRPDLKKLGFSKFTTRNSWRYQDQVIDVINFQSFNSYNADVMGVTTFSFSVNLGSYHIDIPSQHKIKEKDGLLRPEEYESPFRGGLARTIQQSEIDRDDIWFLNQEGTNVEECVIDARNQILDLGMRWFERLSSKEDLRSILKYEKEDMHNLWGFGNNPSPNRSYLLGYVELILGNKSEARKNFSHVVDSGCYKYLFESVDGAISNAL